MVSKMITIKGEKVQGIGYRPFLLEKAVRLKIKYFDAVNVESEDEADNEIQILVVYVSGEDKQISEFVEFAMSEKGRPKMARVDFVISDEYTDDVISIGEYRNILNAEQQSKTVQGGLLIVHVLKNETNKNLELLRTETTKNFEKMDKKYKLISEGMFAIVKEMKETNRLSDKRLEKLEERNEIVDRRMERTEKNIERLLDILAKK